MKNVSQGSGHSLRQPGQCFGRNGNLMAGDPDCGFCEKLHASAADASATDAHAGTYGRQRRRNSRTDGSAKDND